QQTPRRKRSKHDRGRAVDAAGGRDDPTGGAIGRERSHHRRERHRQKFDRASVTRALAPRVAQHDHREHGRTVGNTFRERTLRSRQRRVHRREDGPVGTIRARRRKLALHGRDRQHSVESTGETVARDRGRRIRAGRLCENVARERADNFGNKCEPGGRSCGRTFSSGFTFSAKHHRDRIAAVTRSSRRYHSAGKQFFAHALATLSQRTGRLRRDRARSTVATFVSRKRSRAGSCDRACRADGGRFTSQGSRSWPDKWRRRIENSGRHESGRSGSVFDQESARPKQWERAESGRSARSEPKRVLSASPAIWSLTISVFSFQFSAFLLDETRAERSIPVFAPGQIDVVDSRRG